MGFWTVATVLLVKGRSAIRQGRTNLPNSRVESNSRVQSLNRLDGWSTGVFLPSFFDALVKSAGQP